MTENTSERYTTTNPEDPNLIELPAIISDKIVVFPDTVFTLTMDRHTMRSAVEAALADGDSALLLTTKDILSAPHTDNLYTTGTEVAVGRIPRMSDNESVILQGVSRVQLIELVRNTPYPVARVRRIVDEVNGDEEVTPQLKAAMRAALTLYRRVVDMNPEIPSQALTFARDIQHPTALADTIASTLDLTLAERLQILETLDAKERLRLVTSLLGKELTLLEIEEEIEAELQAEFEKEQREVYLREQMRVIQSKLGETDIFQAEISELQERIERAGLPPETRVRAMKEISRLALMPPMAPEIGLIHNYIDWLISIPWDTTSDDNLDIVHAQRVLDEDHYGLPRVKDRVLEYIAVRKLAADKMQTPILCFVGPPGTGKTSLGKSIARALGREFVRVSLGGVQDEAEIRGHRRTYVGAMPGRIIQTMSRAGTINPVFMLDEIDKLGMDFHGDPAAALLEVLDPEQNADFVDHYLDVPYDLSKVLFITTANDLYPLPLALEDRLEVIEFPGYIEEEKLAIAKQFLIPKQLEAHGLQDAGIQFQNNALQTIIREYTYEAGVRSLNRRIAEMLRKLARQVAEGKPHNRRVKPDLLHRTLGPPDYMAMRANDEDQIGVVTGLAWTSNGGEILPIEVSLLPGKGSLMLTGQLGDVMQESAQAAMSYMRSLADEFDVPHDDFDNYDLHIHLPEGAIPKDGPSAGITLAIAIISTFTERAIRSDFAMTGEITLRGKVLTVGGIREKVMAAHRARIKNIILPEQNKHHLVEVPKSALRDLNIILVNDMRQVIDAVLLDPPQDQRKRDIIRSSEDDHDEETDEGSDGDDE